MREAVKRKTYVVVGLTAVFQESAGPVVEYMARCHAGREGVLGRDRGAAPARHHQPDRPRRRPLDAPCHSRHSRLGDA
jgi:hypothetical protein